MLIYTHPLLYQVVNVKNLLALNRIPTVLRNEYASGATGDLSAVETWVELWLVNEHDEIKANELIAELKSNPNTEWFCKQCGEKNGGAFEFCWQCETEKK